MRWRLQGCIRDVLCGVVVGAAVREELESDPIFFLRHGYTYSGHSSVCAAALANLAIIEREGLVERAKHVGARLSKGLGSLATDGTICPLYTSHAAEE